MASRRMKIKVVANVGRRVPLPSAEKSGGRPPTPTIGSDLLTNQSEISPMSPIKQLHRANSFSHLNSESNDAMSPLSPAQSPQTFTNLSNESVVQLSKSNDESIHAFSDDSATRLELVTEQNESMEAGVSSPSTSAVMLSSPIKSPVPITYDSRRAPGMGPSSNPNTNTVILSNIQKEIGPVHVASVTSNETLRQRLQKGTNVTKYSILRKEFLATNRSKKPEKKDLTILHYTFWNPPEDKKSSDEEEDDMYEGIDRSVMDIAEELVTDDNGKPPLTPVTEDEEPKKSTGPRVKVGPDGELIIDEQSLIVETSESMRAKRQLSEMETIVGGSTGFYRHKRLPKRGYDWTVKETVRFYKALTMCGTDFSMMAHLFPTRTRTELKAKFKREDRKNSALISRTLACQTFDPMESLSDSSASDPETSKHPATKKRRRSSAKQKGTQIESQIQDNIEEEEIPIQEIPHQFSTGFIGPDIPTFSSVPPNDTHQEILKNYEMRQKFKKKQTKKTLKLPGVRGRPLGFASTKLSFNPKQCESYQDELFQPPTPPPSSPKKISKPRKRLKKVSSTSTELEEMSTLAYLNQTQTQSNIKIHPILDPEPPVPPILRFDASDPLGLKVMPIPLITAEEGEEGVLLLEAPLDVTASAQVFDLPEDRSKTPESNITPPTPTPIQEASTQNHHSRRRMKMVKPRIPRVPGGGGPVGAESPVRGGDEIEIEISCQ